MAQLVDRTGASAAFVGGSVEISASIQRHTCIGMLPVDCAGEVVKYDQRLCRRELRRDNHQQKHYRCCQPACLWNLTRIVRKLRHEELSFRIARTGAT